MSAMASNHHPRECLLNCLFRRRSTKTSKLRVTSLNEGNSPVTGEFPSLRPVTRERFPFDDVIMINELRMHLPVIQSFSLHWRHNEPDGVSNHQPRDCLLNCLFRCRSKKTSKFRVTDLCAENSPGTGEFSAQKASNAENVSIWWRHHVAK